MHVHAWWNIFPPFCAAEITSHVLNSLVSHAVEEPSQLVRVLVQLGLIGPPFPNYKTHHHRHPLCRQSPCVSQALARRVSLPASSAKPLRDVTILECPHWFGVSDRLVRTAKENSHQEKECSHIPTLRPLFLQFCFALHEAGWPSPHGPHGAVASQSS